MHNQEFFIQALVYLSAAVISVPIAKRLGFGSVLGYLIAGVIIGPFVLGLIGKEGEDLMHFAEFGVVMMLLLIGLELRPSLLWKMRISIFGLGGLQLFISTIAIGGIALLFDQSISEAMAIGLILALSSTAMIIQTLVERGQIKTEAGRSAFSVLLMQDIAVIPILALLPLLATEVASIAGESHGHDSVNMIFGYEIIGWVKVALVLIIITGIVLVGRFLARYIFRIIAQTGLREIFTATALFLVVAIAVVMGMVGLSPALGAFLAGVVLADNEYRHELEVNIEPFKGLLLGLFFISVGASMDFNLLIESPGIILSLLAILIVTKFIVLLGLGRAFGLHGGQGMLFSFVLAQGGEFAFVLISYSLQNNVLNPEVSGILLMVVALSMAATPLLLLINEKLIMPRYESSPDEADADTIDDGETPVIMAGFGRFGVPVGRMLIANGIPATILDNNPDNIDILRRFGFKVYYGDATRHGLLHAAGCETAKVFIIALDDMDKALHIADYIQREFPHLEIIGRAVSKQHAYEYLKRGITNYELDTFNAALHISIKALTKLGFAPYQAHRAAKIFRHHNKAIEKELFEHYQEDEVKYLSESKRFAEELEDLLTTEQNASIHEHDTAWDNSSRIEEIKKLQEEENNSKE
ncbi:MAG TPA: monovalent cation:proton antiporter-2 (CPA2) family protein [Bacteroidales bacterium]|nr:monovalent cation:proton antiporter-2 (CPA2) family protein [Bacteroidales bacterium]